MPSSARCPLFKSPAAWVPHAWRPAWYRWDMTVEPLDLSDSFARLSWVQRVAAMIRKMGDDALFEVARTGLHVKQIEHDGRELVGFALRDSTRVPDDLGFLIADMVVDARSCLDMAVDRLVATRNLPWKGPLPSFPLADDQFGTKTSSSWTNIKALPDPYREAIIGIQPHVHPAYRVAVGCIGPELRELSNANKHSNLTPVIARNSGPWVPKPADSEWRREDSTAFSPWGEEPLFMLSRQSPGCFEAKLPEGELTSLLTLAIDGGPRFDAEIPRSQGAKVRLHVDLNRMLEDVPRYVELALHRLQEADAWWLGPRTEPLQLSWDLRI